MAAKNYYMSRRNHFNLSKQRLHFCITCADREMEIKRSTIRGSFANPYSLTAVFKCF